MKRNVTTGLLAAVMMFAACDKSKDDVSKYYLNSNSVVEWKGFLQNGGNNGTFDVGANNIDVKDGVVTGGKFVIPIASIKNLNIPDAVPRAELLHHLQSQDFLHVAKYPEARFEITKVEPFTGNAPEGVPGANYTVTGNFTLIGKTNPISFPAAISVTEEDVDIKSKFMLDKSKWGMNYANDPAKPLYILNDVEIKFSLKGDRKK